MKKSIMPSILTGGAVIALIAVLIVSMVFVCLGDNVDAPERRPQQGLPQIITPGEDGEQQQLPSFDFNDTDGYLEISFGSSTIFRTESSLQVRSSIRIRELYGNTVTVKSIRCSVYNGIDCVHTGYAEPSNLLKSTVIGGGGVSEFRHTVELYDSAYVGNVTVVYVITWQDADGNEGVCSCRQEFSDN